MPGLTWDACIICLNQPIVVQKLTQVPHLFSCLPQKGHWLAPVHYVYRTLLRGQKYLSFTEGEIQKVAGGLPPFAY